MDSNSKYKSRDQRYEEALKRRLGEALDQPVAHGVEPCPDAEQIAANYERELSPDEAAQCEAHFATCSQCRKTLALLAATTNTPLAQKDVAQLSEPGAIESAPNSNIRPRATAPRLKRFDWRMRWLAPALGVAAAMATWFAIRPPWRTWDEGPSGNLVARNMEKESLPPPEAAPANRAAEGPPARQQTDSLRPLKTQKIEPPANTKSPLRGSEPSETNQLRSNENADALASNAVSSETAPEKEPEKEKDSADLKKAMTNAQPAAASPASAPPPTPAASSRAQAMQEPSRSANQAAPSPQVSASTSQSVAVTGEAPIVSSTVSAAPAPSARDKQAAADQRKAPVQAMSARNFKKLDLVGAPALEVSAPHGQVRWRIGKGGMIERSSNAGKAWTPQASPSNEDWLAGVAVSDSICWIVGSNGAIARTTDGEHWETVAPPPASADASGKLPGWVNVAAASAQNVTISADDGRRFVTQDGGKTWQAQ